MILSVSSAVFARMYWSIGCICSKGTASPPSSRRRGSKVWTWPVVGLVSAREPRRKRKVLRRLAVDLFGQALEQGQGGDYVLAEVDAGDPEADDVAAELVHDGDGVDEVAEGFGEGAALFVEGPAVGGYGLEGGAVVHADGAEEGGHEPAAVLVAALGV